jgi:hypothetical protein
VLLEARLEPGVVLVQELVVPVHEQAEAGARLIGGTALPVAALGEAISLAALLLTLAQLAIERRSTADATPGA